MDSLKDQMEAMAAQANDAESRLRAVQPVADYRKKDYSNFTTNHDSETSVRIAS